MDRIERRPMELEERSWWKRATMSARALRHVCRCGKPATRLLGSLQTGTWYCADDFAVARSLTQRAAMRAPR
jgi:hypothetical protein